MKATQSELSAVKEQTSSKARSMYKALLQEVMVNDKAVHTKGRIKSLQPPRKKDALTSKKHPYTSNNCFSSYPSYRIHFSITNLVG